MAGFYSAVDMNLPKYFPLILAGLFLVGCANGNTHREYHPFRDTSMDMEQAYDICKMEADTRLHNTGWGISAYVQSEKYMHSCMAEHGYRH